MIDYRARATRAEQENARLREQLERKPNFKWFVLQIKAMLKMEPGAPTNEVIARVKVLRDNQELYKSGKELRKINKQERELAFKEGVTEGRRLERERLIKELDKAP